MKRAVMPMVCIVLLSACTTTQKLWPEKPPELNARANTALLVVVRQAFLGGTIVFSNYLDGKFIGETMGKTYIVTQVPPGKRYVVAVSENTAVAYLNFQAGKRYFLSQGVTMGMEGARSSGFSPMTALEAQNAVRNCTLLQLDSRRTYPDMDAALYQKAIEAYHAGVKENPDGFKAMLEYQGE